ncbi:hypothetical protein Nepgr_001622 [Nepenthes gracilis]|uniref:Uncharacterized protein n=1 Tax=Nepenthes gracilis TaxID=150966 RepID=A0AAD3P7H3_NEPGR|nr:hypothetical protein Nepgr_001622 [Nepenthes gracilis]
MASMGAEVSKKAMWLYPKVVGFNPSERWGHTSCYSHGVVYVFGGCCGGLHFSDILMLNINTMAWSTLMATGEGPGPRDSHSSALWGNKMIVFGGTNGSKKVNDLHIMDLGTNVWTRPVCRGTPPSPRESHTATLVGGEKLVVFGGSGEGMGVYLNDLHILDLKTMSWTSPEVKGEVPSPRDSHAAVAVGNKVFIYGGDCGDRYHGGLDMFDVDTFTWTRLSVQGSSPGARAGHAAVTIGTKIYVVGGVGDKRYYNDAWALDTSSCSWAKLNICGQPPQGRFSHTAVVMELDIAIYGGCGEDERPRGELLILHLGADHPNGRYNVSLCKSFRRHWNQERRKFQQGAVNNLKTMVFGGGNEAERIRSHEPDSRPNQSCHFGSDPKRRRTINSSTWEMESEPEEHSLSVSQHSSPSQSDHEQTSAQKTQTFMSTSQGLPFFNQPSQSVRRPKPSNNAMGNTSLPNWVTRQDLPDRYSSIEEKQSNQKLEYCSGVCQLGIQIADERSKQEGRSQYPIGAEVRGSVDGVFDSGYLMTATVNGRILRGVLFATGPGVVYRGANSSSVSSHIAACCSRPGAEQIQSFSQKKVPGPSPPPLGPLSSIGRESTHRGDLQGVVLTLGGPGSSHG